MLSRVADALFWLSRYTERAENNARMMDVNLQLMLDVQPLANNQQHWESIIFTLEDTKLFNKLYPEITGDAVVDFVTFERKNPNSIYSCIATARENARTVREQISVEMWEQINRMYLFFFSGAAKRMFQNSTLRIFQMDPGRIAAVPRCHRRNDGARRRLGIHSVGNVPRAR